MEVLEHAIRTDLDKRAPRTMAVLNPLRIRITNLPDGHSDNVQTPLFPKNKELGFKQSHLTSVIFIDRADFREAADSDFFGLTPYGEVGLKYSGILKANEVIRNEQGDIVELRCEYSSEVRQIKGRIHWISEVDAVKAEVRIYDYLFTVDEPIKQKEPLECVNKDSLRVLTNALFNKNLLPDIAVHKQFQFERLGYFAVDPDTNSNSGRFVFNSTVDMGDGKLRKI